MKIKFDELISVQNIIKDNKKHFSLSLLKMESDDKVNFIERTYEKTSETISSFYNTTHLHVYSFHKPISKPINLIIDNE